MPMMQLVHESAEAPLIEYDPALQGPVGALRPRDAQYMPTKQGKHKDCPVLFCCVPMAHALHEAATAPPVENEPAWQLPETDPSPVFAQYLPGSHSVHMADDAPPGEYVPIWHKPLTAERPVDVQ